MKRAIPMSQGELEMVHGKVETRDFIARGIFKKVREKPYPQYLKIQEIATWGKSSSTTATASRHRHNYICICAIEPRIVVVGVGVDVVVCWCMGVLYDVHA